jgi:acetylornithine/succinyldiaminopimelate/putrescine aminotransferase
VEIRRKGLVMGLRFDHPNGAVHMMKALYDNGIWAIFSSFDSSVLQWKPGLLVDNAYCDEALEKFERAIRIAADRSDNSEKISFLRASNG